MRKRLGESGFNHVDSELNSKIMVKKTLKIYESSIQDYNLGDKKWKIRLMHLEIGKC